jgi:hypothetical protein
MTLAVCRPSYPLEEAAAAQLRAAKRHVHGKLVIAAR